MTFVRAFLLAFGGVALFVGAFVIFNTLSITVAQRTREFATLRTLGASRRQVLRSVLLESFALGLGASLVGLAAGVGLAKGLGALLSAFGLGAPAGFARLRHPHRRRLARRRRPGHPARRVAAGASRRRGCRRSPPSAKVRSRGAPTASASSSGSPSAALGFALLVYSAFGSGSPIPVVAGCLLLFIGVATVAARLVPGLVGGRRAAVARRSAGPPAGWRPGTRPAALPARPRPRLR